MSTTDPAFSSVCRCGLTDFNSAWEAQGNMGRGMIILGFAPLCSGEGDWQEEKEREAKSVKSDGPG